MPSDAMGEVAFRPVIRDDYALLEVWLNSPHMREWWGDSDDELGFIRDMVEGRDTTRPYLITLDARPVGYIQCWYVGPHQTEEWTTDNPWISELPNDAVGVDLSIGEPDLLSRGIGTAALERFVAMLRAEGHETIIIDPDPANSRAVRAYTKAGFRPVPELQGRFDDVLVMQFDPNRK
ncbi:MAG: GNAT family N-acetyltransferase [Rhizobiaceae bacterium]